MSDDILQLDLGKGKANMIKVIGVGGGGGNAVKHMFKQGIVDVNFAICNTDSQALHFSNIPERVALGGDLTAGRGAGNKPEVGRQAAEESIEDIERLVDSDTRMVFIAAGMGGGTGTGAAPVIARQCKLKGMLTIAIVTIPSRSEGRKRRRQAIEGIKELEQHVDSLIMIDSERIRDIYGNLVLREAFARADDILLTAAKGIAELITKEGRIQVDFEDVKTVMKNSGVANMGSARATGGTRAYDAVSSALNSPLLCVNSIFGAKDVLINATSGDGDGELTMDEVDVILTYVQEKAGNDANIIWGYSLEEGMGDELQVMIVVTGFCSGGVSAVDEMMPQKKVVMLDEDRRELREREQANYNAKAEQSTIKFNVAEEAAPTEMKREPVAQQDVDVEIDFSEMEDDDFEKLTSSSAYSRKLKRTMRVSPDERQASRSSMQRGEDGEPIMRTGNSYLHDNVD